MALLPYADPPQTAEHSPLYALDTPEEIETHMLLDPPGLRVLYQGDMQRLAVQPGDVLVITCTQRLSDAARQSMTEAMRDVFPQNRVMILDAGLTLGVLSPEEPA